MKTKKCSKCGKKKSLDDYYGYSRSSDGKASLCKACHIKGTKKWQASHQDKVREYKLKSRRKYNAADNRLVAVRCPNCKKDRMVKARYAKEARAKTAICSNCSLRKAVAASADKRRLNDAVRRQRRNESKKQWIENNKKQARETGRRYRENHPNAHSEWCHANEKHVKEYRGNYYRRYKTQVIQRSREWYKNNRKYALSKQRVYGRIQREMLSSTYIKDTLRGTGLSADEIPMDMIKEKANVIRIRRKLRALRKLPEMQMERRRING